MSDLKDIGLFDALNGQPTPGNIPEATLMAYLEGRLTPEEQHKVEEWLSNEGMESDALEGLQTLTPAETSQISNHLNLGLRQTLKGKRRKRRRLLEEKWSWLAIGIVLLLCIIAFAVVFVARKGH